MKRYSIIINMQQEKHQFVAIYGFILNSEQKLLLLRRAEHDSMPGTWETPGGGLEFGENPEEGLIRECKEEAGIDVEVLKPINVTSYLSVKNNLQKHVIRIGFLCSLQNAKQGIVLSSEHDHYQWVSIDKMPPQLSDFCASSLKLLKDAL